MNFSDLSVVNPNILNKVEGHQELLSSTLSLEMVTLNVVPLILPFGEIRLLMEPFSDFIVSFEGTLWSDKLGIIGNMFHELVFIIFTSGLLEFSQQSNVVIVVCHLE